MGVLARPAHRRRSPLDALEALEARASPRKKIPAPARRLVREVGAFVQEMLRLLEEGGLAFVREHLPGPRARSTSRSSAAGLVCPTRQVAYPLSRGSIASPAQQVLFSISGPSAPRASGPSVMRSRCAHYDAPRARRSSRPLAGSSRPPEPGRRAVAPRRRGRSSRGPADIPANLSRRRGAPRREPQARVFWYGSENWPAHPQSPRSPRRALWPSFFRGRGRGGAHHVRIHRDGVGTLAEGSPRGYADGPLAGASFRTRSSPSSAAFAPPRR